MNKEFEEKLKADLKKFEGYRKFPYLCSEGFPTIGIGHKMSVKEQIDFKNGISDDKVQELFEKDVKFAYESALKLVAGKPETVILIITEMIFQMGLNGTKGFRNMFYEIERNNFKEASRDMLKSLWHKQTPKRCEYLADKMASVDEN